MNNLFPYMIVCLFVVLTGPMLTGYIGGLTTDAATELATQIDAAD